ncbi:MAG TPA: hypothetical protein VEA16_06975, partial [Vicinamibacterales bacterium]|nr:hypothetical protein [Vicinamibacterales bacterium]
LRIALGADRASIVALLARRGASAVAAGLIAGWMLATPLAAMLASQTRGVDEAGITTRAMIAVLIAALSIGAMLRPAWRVSTGDIARLLTLDY